jgi:hypothetical protein
MKSKCVQHVTVKFLDCHCNQCSRLVSCMGLNISVSLTCRRIVVATLVNYSVVCTLLHSHACIGIHGNTQDSACGHLFHMIVT